MNKFGLVVIGAHSGIWLSSLLEKYKDQNTLLVEPVPYNIKLLKENTLKYKNVKIETSAISKKKENKKFYFIKPESIKSLGKHWASEIGSFDKKHIINHKKKRFDVSDSDIEEIKIQYLTFSDLLTKYDISSIDMLQIDAEGSEFEIMDSINYKDVKINKIFFESKHFDGTFNEGKKLDQIKKKLILNDYNLKQVDKDNILAEK
jgi:FkbM family methyltransferase